MRKTKAPPSGDEKKPTTDRIDEVIDLIMECCEVNGVSPTEAMSAMATILTTVLCAERNPALVMSVIDELRTSYEEATGAPLT